MRNFRASKCSCRILQTASGNLTAMSPDCVMYLTHGSDGYCNCQAVSGFVRKSSTALWLTLGSVIFKYRTWIPLVVKYGISNFT